MMIMLFGLNMVIMSGCGTSDIGSVRETGNIETDNAEPDNVETGNMETGNMDKDNIDKDDVDKDDVETGSIETGKSSDIHDEETIMRKYDFEDLVITEYVNDCTYMVDTYNIESGKYEDKEKTSMYRIPRVILSGSYVEEINSEIYSTLYPIIQDAVKEINEYGYPYASDEITYYGAVNGDVLSLVIKNLSYPRGSGGSVYMVYNISISTGDCISKNELLSIAGVSQDEYHDILWQALGSTYYEGKESYIEQMGDAEFFYKQLEKTISEENIQKCVPYLNEQGQLCIIGAIYSVAAADYYYHDINLVNCPENPAFSKYIEEHGQ